MVGLGAFTQSFSFGEDRGQIVLVGVVELHSYRELGDRSYIVDENRGPVKEAQMVWASHDCPDRQFYSDGLSRVLK